jgi:two-component system, chemotaxis family, chemotaxis protein CheY
MLRKILIVDDSTLIQHMYELFLARYRGVRLLNAMNGAVALEVLGREAEIDLLLLDINMPVMNGLELLQRMKSEPSYRDIPVIVITTQGKEEDVARCMALGASACLHKPFQTPELYKAIETATGVRPS